MTMTYKCAGSGHGSSFVGLSETAKAVKGTIAPLCPIHAREARKEGKEIISLAQALRDVQAAHQQVAAATARRNAARATGASRKIGHMHLAVRGGQKAARRAVYGNETWAAYVARQPLAKS